LLSNEKPKVLLFPFYCFAIVKNNLTDTGHLTPRSDLFTWLAMPIKAKNRWRGRGSINPKAVSLFQNWIEKNTFFSHGKL
jgi:hypothetical protein